MKHNILISTDCIFAHLHPEKTGTSLRSVFAVFLMFISAHLLPVNRDIFANNVAISNTVVSGDKIRFNISWDNSWRVSQPPYSYDAVWVFVKYAQCTGGVQVWQHATLHTDAAQDSTGTNLEIKTSLNSDGQCYGVYIQRSTSNMGGPSSIASTKVRLTFAAGVPPVGPTYNFRVYGIETVYIPNGDFQIGDGASTSTFSSVTVNAAFETSGAANTSTAIGGAGTTTNALPAAYPVGWTAFYCMKYEISQEEYVDFLNTLTYDQQASRTAVAPNTAPAPNPAYVFGSGAPATGSNRNGIRIQTPGVNNTTPAIYGCDLNNNNSFSDNNDGMNIACNFLNWADVAAYLDWACLRPMSDLEYEKVCRGTVARVSRETANGIGITASYYDYGPTSGRWLGMFSGWCPAAANFTVEFIGSNNLSNAGFSNETPNTASCQGIPNPCVTGARAGAPVTMGPIRVGALAYTSSSRTTAGAGYYGVLDLSGNVWERVVSTDANGVGFSETAQGNGVLDAVGDANTGTWPPAAATGSGRRGGAWDSEGTWGGSAAGCGIIYNCMDGTDASISRYVVSTYLPICTSDRTYSTTVDATRNRSYGGRGVRNP